MKQKPNILVVCGRNKKRSKTAETIFRNDQRFNIRSAGLSPQSNHQIHAKDIDWADLICVMENSHSKRITSEFRNIELPYIEVLQIEDIYEYMDEELVVLLTTAVNSIIESIDTE